MLIDFCLPVYNEEKILEQNTLLLHDFCSENIKNISWRIVILVNGSCDASASIANDLSKKYPKKIIYRDYEFGGRGLVLRNYWAESEADFFLYMDMDLAVSLECIPLAVDMLVNKGADIVIGSRMLKGSRVQRSFIRELTSRGYVLLSKILLDHDLFDLQCGFKGIKKEAFNLISDKIEDKKWFFDTELLVWGKRKGLNIQEIPVDWSENRYDERKSKVKIFRDAWRFIKKNIELRKKLKNDKKTFYQ